VIINSILNEIILCSENNKKHNVLRCNVEFKIELNKYSFGFSLFFFLNQVTLKCDQVAEQILQVRTPQMFQLNQVTCIDYFVKASLRAFLRFAMNLQ
jgi:hypothetical protein